MARHDEDDNTDNAWHLDRRVPLGIIIAIVVQTITLVVVGVKWKTDVDHKIETLEKSEAERRPQESRLIVLEQRLTFIAESLGRIENRLERYSLDRQP